MKIAILSSEVFPYAKTGGLADVVAAIAKFLVKAGHEVVIFLPWYKKTADEYGDKAEKKESGRYFEIIDNDGVKFVFIKNDSFFFRDGFYSNNQTKKDYPDNLERFSFFCDRALWLMKYMDFQPDIVHAHDWQTALAVILIKTALCRNPFFEKTKTLFTIHNIQHQGIFGANQFKVLRDIDIYDSHFNMHELEYYGNINLLKGAVVLSDFVNTVSPTYAREVLTVEFGVGMEGVLEKKGGAFCGILNGIDTELWNPMTDRNIDVNFGINNFPNKAKNKLAFQKEMGLEVDESKMLLALVSRFSRQKGIDSIAECISSLPENCQIAILGDGDERNEDDKPYKMHLTALRNGKEKKLSLTIGHHEKLARKFYAAADAFLVPSRFEPCGLTQLYSYVYGTLPIVFPVGGLRDTVVDFSQGGHGFVCDSDGLNSRGLLAKIKEAHRIYYEQPEEWKQRAIKAMQLDYSWGNSIKRYISLYQYLSTGVFPC